MLKRTKDLNLSVIKQVELKASQYPDAISLAQGIPGCDTPKYIKKRAENALRKGEVSKYSLSPGLPELRELIELSLEKENMFYDWRKEILVTAGAIEGIMASIMTTTVPGDEVIIPEPTYTSYAEVIKLCGCVPVAVSLDKKNRWGLRAEAFEKALSERTKVIFYCNPNNPTGTVYSKEELMELARLAEEHDLFLISDEVYKDFVFQEKKLFSLAEVSELRKRVIRIYSFSKSFAMTGWRVGYLHGEESVVREITKVHDSMVTCAPVISQYAAMGALEVSEREISTARKEYEKMRKLVCERMDRMDDLFSYVKPEGTYYAFPEINPKNKKIEKVRLTESGEVDSCEFVDFLLENLQVALVPGVAFGASGEGHVRINFGRSSRDVEEAFNRIEKYFYD